MTRNKRYIKFKVEPWTKVQCENVQNYSKMEIIIRVKKKQRAKEKERTRIFPCGYCNYTRWMKTWWDLEIVAQLSAI